MHWTQLHMQLNYIIFKNRQKFENLHSVEKNTIIKKNVFALLFVLKQRTVLPDSKQTLQIHNIK